MQTYGAGFARVYNQRWAGFARQVAPPILNFYRSIAIGQTDLTLLDLCCGTGQLTVYFLEHGFRVTGIDLSSEMLEYARENAAHYIGNGHARFERADASHFSVADRFGLVVSTFDALNHLDSFEPCVSVSTRCFRCWWTKVSSSLT